MAEIRTKLIVELPLAQKFNGSEIFPIQQDGITRKAASDDIMNYAKTQDFASWVYAASSNLFSKSLTSYYLTMIADPSNGTQPEFFIGESRVSSTGALTGLSGFKFNYDSNFDNFVFSRSVSAANNAIVLTAYYIDQKAFTYINNLSTSNILSAKNILVTDGLNITTSNGGDSLFILQNGSGNALRIFDETNDSTPFIISNDGRVGIKTTNLLADLTINGNLSSSGNLVSNVLSAGSTVYDRIGNSLNWNSGYSTWNSSSGMSVPATSFVATNSTNLLNISTTVNNTSANWNSVYSNWNSVSSFDLATRTYVGNNSGGLNNAISVSNNINNYALKSYVDSSFLKADGGAITGALNVSGRAEFAQDVVVRGVLSAFSIVNVSPTVVAQSATSLIIDLSASIGKELIVGGNAFFGKSVMTTGNTNVSGNIVTLGNITAANGNSINWNSVYSNWNSVSTFDLNARSFVGNNSTNQLSVYSHTNANSSIWSSGGISNWSSLSASEREATSWVQRNSSNITSEWNNVSSFYLNARTFVGNNSANQLSVYSHTNANSALWTTGGSSNWSTLSSSHIEARTFVGNNSTNQLSVYSHTRSNSASWGTGGSYGSVYSSNSSTYLTNVSGDSTYVRLNNFPSLAYVPLSGGTMSGALTVNQVIYANYAGRTGNSTDWNITSNYYYTSAKRIEETSSIVDRLSSRWNSVYTTVNTTSALLRGAVSLTFGQTVVNTPQYVVGGIDVFLNGVKLINGQDFTATTGNTIVLAEATKNSNYYLEYVGYPVYATDNSVLKTGDTMTGGLTVPTLTVTNQQVNANITGNTSGVHVGSVNGFGDNTIVTGEIKSINLNVSGGAVFSSSGTNETVKIINTGTGPSLLVEDSTSTDATPFVVDAEGNVGIGISTPNGKLHVNNAISLGTDLNNSITLARFTNLNPSTSNLTIGQFRNTGGQNTASTATTRIQQRTGNTSEGYISFNPLGNTNGVAIGTHVGSTATDALTITGSTNLVGIGTTTPTERLTVFGNISSNGNIVNRGNVQTLGTITAGNFVGDGSGLVNLNSNKSFLKFPEEVNYCGGPTLYRTAAFLSKGNGLFVSGFSGWNDAAATANTAIDFYGLDDDGYARTGFHELPIDRLLSTGDYIKNVYISFRNMFVLTNQGKLYGIGRNKSSELGFVGADETDFVRIGGNLTTLNDISWVSISNHSWSSYAEYDLSTDPHVFAINNGQLYGWGNNTNNRIGVSTASPVTSPTLVGTTGQSTVLIGKTLVKAYACGDEKRSSNLGYSFVVDSTRKLYACGNNSTGQLGFGATDITARTVFSEVVGILCDKLTSVGFGGRATTYVLNGTTLLGCGDNSFGQLGIATTTAYRGSFASIATNVANFASGSVSNASLYVLLNNGELHSVGLNGSGLTTGNTTVGFYSFGGTSQGHLGLGNNNNTSTLTKVTVNYSDLSSLTSNDPAVHGVFFTKVKMIDGPAQATAPAAGSVAAANPGSNVSYPTAYALDSNGNIWGAGYNGYGQLGNGTTTNSNYFVRAHKPKDIRFVDFYPVGYRSGTGIIAVDQYGDLWAWGYNGESTLGINMPIRNAVTIPRRCYIA
jgi:alpha-tubulin suppressor-like RCC1 family protein